MTLGQRSRSRMTLKRHISTYIEWFKYYQIWYISQLKKFNAKMFLHQTQVFITLYNKVYHTIRVYVYLTEYLCLSYHTWIFLHRSQMFVTPLCKVYHNIGLVFIKLCANVVLSGKDVFTWSNYFHQTRQ